MTLKKKTGVALGVLALAMVGLQFALAPGATEFGAYQYKLRAEGGLAAGCAPPIASTQWVGINAFVIDVHQECGIKAGEGMKVRVRRVIGGWRVVEVFDHWVA